MTDKDAFSDFYSILHVHPSCDAKILESAYHHLAKAYHPDHTGIEDSTDFHAVTQAYKVLRDPGQRTEYDALYVHHFSGKPTAPPAEAMNGDEQDLLTDAEAHDKILRYLYERRRRTPSDAGVAGFYLEEMLHCSYESLEFHKWYLKEKGFIATSEQGTLAITVQGIDQVLMTAKTIRTEKLMLAQSSSAQDQCTS
jgi:curved DNA-binding protein